MERISYLLTHDFSAKELESLNSKETLIALWKTRGIALVEVAEVRPISMTTKEFLTHCTACGGDWGAMLLSGIKELSPLVYDLIPDNMGVFSFCAICELLDVLGVKDVEEKG